MRKDYYWEFANGHSGWFTDSHAIYLANKYKTKITSRVDPREKKSRPARIRDGFNDTVANRYHPYFKCVVKSMEHFKLLCRAHNVELSDKHHTTADFEKEVNFMDADLIKESKAMGADISDREADALIKGERMYQAPIEHVSDET